MVAEKGADLIKEYWMKKTWIFLCSFVLWTKSVKCQCQEHWGGSILHTVIATTGKNPCYELTL
jgi:hypothetical protein